MDTKYFKKFDLEHARAGAPIRTASHDVEILKWDARSPNPIIGIIKTGLGDVAWSWPADGGGINDAQRLIMAPLGRCEGEPVWWGDILFDAAGRAVEFAAIVPDDFDFSAYTRKAAPKWPKTTLTSRQLCDMDDGTAGRDGDAYITFANKIIAHECEAGNLVPANRLRPIVRGVLGQYGIDADGYALDAIITSVRSAS